MKGSIQMSQVKITNSVQAYYTLVLLKVRNLYTEITNEINRTSVFNKTRLLYLFNNKTRLESELYALELKFKKID